MYARITLYSADGRKIDGAIASSPEDQDSITTAMLDHSPEGSMCVCQPIGYSLALATLPAKQEASLDRDDVTDKQLREAFRAIAVDYAVLSGSAILEVRGRTLSRLYEGLLALQSDSWIPWSAIMDDSVRPASWDWPTA